MHERRLASLASHGMTIAGCALLLLAAACSDDGDDADDAGGGTDERTATFVTYNAGLAVGFVDHAPERAGVTSQAIAELEADVVCVQEVWLPEHVMGLAGATMQALPEQLFVDPMPSVPMGTDPACPPEEADPLEACVRDNCGDVSDDALADCVIESCGELFMSTSSDCQTCLAAQVGNSLDVILDACASGPGGEYAYDGSFGIGILTHGDILEQGTLVLESTINRRAVQYARVALPQATVDVFCTHLTAIFDDIPYPRDAGSWAEEQAVQIAALREFVDDYAGADGGVVVMGDFNTGPAGEGVVAEFPENYDALISGFDNPYLEQPNPPCTFCADNPLVGGADDDDSVIIDHVLTRGLAGEVVSASRVLDEPVEISSAAGPLTTAYSDHYGVAVTVEFDAP